MPAKPRDSMVFQFIYYYHETITSKYGFPGPAIDTNKNNARHWKHARVKQQTVLKADVCQLRRFDDEKMKLLSSE